VGTNTVTAGRFIRVVVALDGLLFALAAGLALALASGDALAGVLVGGGIGTVNLLVLSWLCRRAIAFPGRRWFYIGGMIAKFVVLGVLVFLAVLFVPMDVIGFVAGLSVSGVALLGAASWLSCSGAELTL
jgi:hypothetical protein